ncbi:MAG: 5-dehydro-2-deoxygluconokinase [Candidatus Accumulibacter sp.]|jgi:5-dehydro-2-deoxygluconokinase|nr:5-dehydro-2-deoxygluconokinase [Accumulibacter sp.]
MKRGRDLICMGRAAVDLYGEQIGGRLEDMLSFRKYLGGSPTNTAVGTARLGMKVAMLTRVGDEHLGRFVRETLAAEGVDVSHVKTDPKRLTGLVFLGIRDSRTFPQIFYRDNCADMAIAEEDFDADFLASATAFLLSGTHLSQPSTYEICLRAVAFARSAGTRVALDIDYRPVLWGLARPGMGEERFVPSPETSKRLQSMIRLCDLVVGTEEEMHIAGESTDTLAAVRRLRELTAATLVVKRGSMGCVVFDAEIPGRLEEGIKGPGFPVDIFNVLGAGDAFMSGFLRGWIRGEPLPRCCTYANACGALVVSRHGCAPAMPSWEELQFFLAHGSPARRLREDARLEHLHRVSTRARQWPDLAVLAFDHRAQLEDAARRHASGHDRINLFKRLIAEGARIGAGHRPNTGIIVDSQFGDDVLSSMTGQGRWIARPVEAARSRPLRFDAGVHLNSAMRAWPGEHVAKCLVIYHPRDPAALRELQLARLAELQFACVDTTHELLIEIIPPPDLPRDGTTLAESLEQIYQAGVFPDWWKLQPPASDEEWEKLSGVVEHHDPHCRGILLLGQEAGEETLRRNFQRAAPFNVCQGFAVGRSIFSDVAERWFGGALRDSEAVAMIAARYARLIDLWDGFRGPNPRNRANGHGGQAPGGGTDGLGRK